MTASVTPIKTPLASHEDNSPSVREKTASIAARTDRIKRVLASPAALPEMRAQAKGELVVLAAEALALWGEL